MKITISGGACLSGLPPDAMLSVFLMSNKKLLPHTNTG